MKRFILGIAIGVITFLSILFILNLTIFNNSTSSQKKLIENLDDSSEKSQLIFVEGLTIPTYLKSNEKFNLVKNEEHFYNEVKETNHIYSNLKGDKKFTLTVRNFSEIDNLVMLRYENDSVNQSDVELIQIRDSIMDYKLFRFDRFPISIIEDLSFGSDISTYPIGMEQLGDKYYRMLGKTFNSKWIEIEYENGNKSVLRDLVSEKEEYSTQEVNDSFVSIHELNTQGKDITETWWIESTKPLFDSNESMDSWMEETSHNTRLRNMWYTMDGPYNKMASAIEPLPESGQGFGRLLLLVKDDRALAKYKETNERYFQILLRNSFVDLIKFKEDKNFWETEVTSTWLQRLYGMNAPFIDTRFNELIALFVYETGIVLGYENYLEGLDNYAEFLVKQAEHGNVINSHTNKGYYIQDYFSVNQDIKTHSSLNHLLGGLNILLKAYKETENKAYYNVAKQILSAIDDDKELWIRKDNGDLFYQINIDGEYAENDYQHLTMADLAYSYQLLKNIDKDSQYLKAIDFLLKTKFDYLNKNNLGSSAKLRQRLIEIGKEELIPAGPELVDGH